MRNVTKYSVFPIILCIAVLLQSMCSVLGQVLPSIFGVCVCERAFCVKHAIYLVFLFNFNSTVNMAFVRFTRSKRRLCFEHHAVLLLRNPSLPLWYFPKVVYFFPLSFASSSRREITLMGLIFHWIHRFESLRFFSMFLHRLNPSPSK